jgi:hypothetical protein
LHRRLTLRAPSKTSDEFMERIDDLHSTTALGNIYAGTVIVVLDSAFSALISESEDLLAARGVKIYANLEPKINGQPISLFATEPSLMLSNSCRKQVLKKHRA